MLTIRFIQTTNAANCEEPTFNKLSRLLVLMVLRDHRQARGFSDLLKYKYPHPDVERRLQIYISSAVRSESAEAIDFYRALYRSYNDAAGSSEWYNALPDLVECVFVELMNHKYEQQVQRGIMRMHHECRLEVFRKPPDREVDLGNMSVDAIAWSAPHTCGDFVEVKRDLESFSSSNKIRRLIRLKEELDEAVPKALSIVAIGSFTVMRSDSARAYLAAALGDPEMLLPILTITFHTLVPWLNEKVL